MATIVIALLLCILVYELCIFIMYPPGVSHTRKPVETEIELAKETASDDDIMGKSHFDMKKECRLMRQRKEEADRKAAIAKGEMTEDGKEIAQEVQAKDCEVEQKKVWKQVPTEELHDMFDEPEAADEPNGPLADGGTIDDIDLAFKNARRKDLSEEEELQVVKVFKELKGTEFLDAVEQQFSEVGTRIDELIEKHSAKSEGELVISKSFEDFKPSDYM